MSLADRSPDSRPTSERLRLPTHFWAVALCSRKTAAYSCRAVAAFHRASRASRQRTAFLRQLHVKNHQHLSVGRPTGSELPAPPKSMCTSNREERASWRVLPVRTGQADSNRRELSRSPGSRFFGWKLPSQRCAAPVAYSLRSSALTVAGPLRICTGFPY